MQNNLQIVDDFYETTVWAVEEKMRANKEVAELRKKMAENNKTFFDKKKEVAFQDDYGKDGVMFNEKYYEDYQNVLNHYNIMYLELNNEKNAIKSKLGFGKKKKLEEINRKIDKLNEKMDVYCEIRNREEIFEQTWQKNGKFFDLNKEFKDRENKIREDYIKEAVKEIFEKHPEYSIYDFSKVNLPKIVKNEINEYQTACENNLGQFKNIKINNKNEFGNGDDGTPNSGIEREKEM